MSDRARIPQWRDALRDSELDRTAKLVGFVLSTYMDARGAAWPAKTTLARGASLGREPAPGGERRKGNTAVDTAIDRLEAAGLLDVDRKRGRRGFHYTALIPRGYVGLTHEESHAATGDNGDKSHAGTGDNAEVNPTRNGAKSHADSSLIPRPGVGEVEESDESEDLTTARVRARKKHRRADALSEDQEQRLARLDG